MKAIKSQFISQQRIIEKIYKLYNNMRIAVIYNTYIQYVLKFIHAV